VLKVDEDVDGIMAELKDHATEETFTFSLTLTFPSRGEFLITTIGGPAEKIHFFPREGNKHVRFTGNEAPLSTEDEQTLTLWVQSIRQYLRLYLTTTPYTLFFRFLMNRALLKMNPSQRKISLMLYRFTLLEIVVILIIVVGYFTLGR
jgi:hypothetical protein